MGASASTTSLDPAMAATSATSGAVALNAYKMLRDIQIKVEFEIGDMVEVHRGLTCHWMLYIGNCEVVHISIHPLALISCCAGYMITDALIPKIDASGMFQKICKGMVIVSNIYDVLKDADKVRKNNKEDLAKKAKMEPLSVKETLKRALDMWGKEVDYELQQKNCEYYVTSWKYENAEKLLEVDCEDSIVKSPGSFLYEGLVKVGKAI